MVIKVIKLSAEWCNPCKVLSPIFEEVKKELESGDITFESLTEDDDEKRFRNLTTSFDVRGLPTILILNESETELYDRLTGVKPKELIKDKILEFIK